jgi:hypothetical protein
VRGRGCRLYGTIDRTQLASQEVRVRTSEHVRQLEAPTKSDDYLPACIIPRDEPMRVRKNVRELCSVPSSVEPAARERETSVRI